MESLQRADETLWKTKQILRKAEETKWTTAEEHLWKAMETYEKLRKIDERLRKSYKNPYQGHAR